ncbi:monofunctional biosynthetic peptidoglycan transglycosylase [Escherichia coli]|uniref:Monofunctional biosynthetic peptidoglycan transglycosylase n=1 Tax=Escherichia coli TaxID=562 RepID=A0A484YPM1_ECOLX|nr:monofunctional biosynthetic peptidoglycan transglycosylase [Escherichia coli]
MGLAVIAAEDQKFPEHWGFDVASIEQALAHNERNENRIRGASTISQQTAKNLFLWDGRSWVRKGLEAGLTLGIETVWEQKAYPDGLPEYRRIWRRCVWRRSCGTTLFPQTRGANLPGRKLHCWQLYYLIHFVSKSPRHRATCVAVRRGFYGRCIS